MTESAPPPPTLFDRAVAATIVLAAVAIVVPLALVDADPRGHGTHEALGMDPCDWADELGRPCPTCGVTTAATHLVHLRPLTAMWTQPFGALLAAGGLWLAAVAAWSLVRNQPFLARIALWPYGTILVGYVALLFAAWAWTDWRWER